MGLEDLKARLLRHVSIQGGCWVWMGSKTADGYGRMQWQRRAQGAHRISFFVFKGPIPEGLEIDHTCRVRDCINPDHLDAVTHQENIRRSRAPGQDQRHDHCPQGHEISPSNVKLNTYGYRRCRACIRKQKMDYKIRHKAVVAAKAKIYDRARRQKIKAEKCPPTI